MTRWFRGTVGRGARVRPSWAARTAGLGLLLSSALVRAQPAEPPEDLDGVPASSGVAGAPGSTSTATSTPTRTSSTAPVLDEPLAPELPPPQASTATTAPSPERVDLLGVELPNQIGPAWIDAGVGRLRLGLATQLLTELQTGSGTEDGFDSRVLIRRLRLSLSGRFLDDRLSFAFQLNTTPGNFEVVDMWLDYEIIPQFRLRLGQMKIPLDGYRALSFSRLSNVDWSITTSWFGSERQLGLVIHSAEDRPGLDYNIGLFTGQNRRAGHAIALPNFYGEPTSNPSRVDGVGEVDTIHPEIVTSVEFASEGFATDAISDRRGGPLRYRFGLGAAWDVRPEEGRDFTFRLVPEAWIKVRHLSVYVIGYLGVAELTQTDETGWGAMGGNLETAYRFSQAFELGARYGTVVVNRDLSDDAIARGQAFIDAAETPDDAEALIAQYGSAGDLRRQHQLLGSFNIYLVGHSLKLQTEVGWRRDVLTTKNADRFIAVLQVQFAF